MEPVPPRIQLKTAIVTGGTSGIGLGIVKMLLAKKIPTFIIATSASGAADLANSIGPSPTTWKYYVADIQNWDHLEGAFTDCLSWTSVMGGTLFYVFANGGIGERKWLDLPMGDERPRTFIKPNYQVLDIDLKGTLNTVALAAQAMRKRGYVDPERSDRVIPKIILTTSICGFYALAGLPMYTAAKHALTGFARSYAPILLHDHDIALHAIAPNVVETHISSDIFYSKVKAVSPNLLTPPEVVITAAERIVEKPHNSWEGIIHECGPRGIFTRKDDKDFVPFMDRETVKISDLLEDRGLEAYESSYLEKKAPR